MKHTTGPWEDLGLESPWGYVIKHDSGKSISYIAAYDLNEETPEPFGKWDSESIANRALVLAAPDLLAALQLILPLAKGYAYQHQVGSNQAYCEQAELAIAKAVQA